MDGSPVLHKFATEALRAPVILFAYGNLSVNLKGSFASPQPGAYRIFSCSYSLLERHVS